jgi:uncharacterized GH25 family protein
MRPLVAACLLAVAPAAALAHMVYLVPAADTASATVVFSDTLEADPAVAAAKSKGLTLTARAADGSESPVTLTAAEHHLDAPKGFGNAALVHGSVTYGLMSRGETSSLLVYHPKYVAAGVTGSAATLGAKCPLEIVPVTAGGKTRFQLLAAGKPVANAEGSVRLPDGKKEAVTTDAEGYTAPFTGPGRYAAWLRHTETKAGEYEGKKYTEAKHYATLVVDVK